MAIQDLRGTQFSEEPHPEQRVRDIQLGLQIVQMVKPEIKDFRPLDKGADLVMAENEIKKAEDAVKAEAAKVAADVAAVPAKVEAQAITAASELSKYWPLLVAAVLGAVVGHLL